MKKFLIQAAVALVSLALSLGYIYIFVLPHPAGTEVRRSSGEGSYEHARQWRRQLLACNSLEEVKRRFDCFAIERSPARSHRIIQVSGNTRRPPRALVTSFADDQWIACVYADSHGESGGGTIVTRDSYGAVHVFFGHVCGDLFAEGDTLEEFYNDVRGYNGVQEVPLDDAGR